MSIISDSPWDFSPAVGELSNIWRGLLQDLPRLGIGVIVLALAWLLANLTILVLRKIFSRRFNPLLRTVVARLIGILLFLDGFYLALQVACLSGLSATVLGGTGIAGLVAGIVFRELRENYLASILVSIRNPFRLGDLVKQSFEQENISMPDEAREILFPEGVPFRMVESPSTPEGEGTTNVVSPAKNCN